MNTRVLWYLVELLRNSLEVPDAIVVALQVITWIDLSSKRQDLPFMYHSDSKPQNGQELGDVFAELTRSTVLGENAAAFAYTEGLVRRIDPLSITSLFENAGKLVKNGLIREENIVSEIVESLVQYEPASTLPTEVAELMVALATTDNAKDQESIYIPFNDGLQFGWLANKGGADVWIETLRPSPIPCLLNLLFQSTIHVAVSDPLKSPSFASDGKLRKFDKTISFPPFNWKVDQPIKARSDNFTARGFPASLNTLLIDVFNRFPESTSSGSVLSVRHIISQTKYKAVIAVANGLLFSPGAERSLRKDLIDKGMISTVIALPPALMKKAAIPFSILVLELKEPANGVLFIDASVSNFYQKDGKGRATLTWWNDILELAVNNSESNYKRYVTNVEIRENDYQLQPNRYCLPEEQKQLEHFLESRNCEEIGNYVDFFRPPTSNVVNSDSALDVFEVGVSDFPEFGYLYSPSKLVKIEPKENPKGGDPFLRPRDILIAVKGSVGKIAIVPDSVPAPGQGGWIAAQSCLVIRNEATGKTRFKKDQSLSFSSIVLYMYLRSGIGQMLLKRIENGTTVKLISVRELEILPILDFSEEEKIAAETAFEDLVKLQETIDGARKKQNAMLFQVWPLNL